MFLSHRRSLSQWKSWFSTDRKSPTLVAQRQASLTLEVLEDRAVPTASPAVDLTTAGTSGSINGAIFQQFVFQPAGCGVLSSFVRVQAHGSQTVEQGYNTDAKPFQFDEKSGNFTRSLRLSDVPEVNIGGTQYRAFVLDINQNASQPLLSLDELRIFLGSAPNLTGYDTTANTLAGLSPIYDMGAGNWVELNGLLAQGTGKGDMALFVPDSDFAGSGGYVYLYSKFGVNEAANAGFEQWAVQVTSSTPVATTATISGFVRDSFGNALSGFTVVLTGTANNGQTVVLTAPTDANGFYAFAALPPGTYTLTEDVGAAVAVNATAGTVGGSTDGTATSGVTSADIAAITLAAGNSGVNYDFVVTFQQ